MGDLSQEQTDTACRHLWTILALALPCTPTYFPENSLSMLLLCLGDRQEQGSSFCKRLQKRGEGTRQEQTGQTF